ncbi:MAG: hypothetical protein ACLTWJ_05470, partial [Flavonifractor plautii]
PGGTGSPWKARLWSEATHFPQEMSAPLLGRLSSAGLILEPCRDLEQTVSGKVRLYKASAMCYNVGY